MCRGIGHGCRLKREMLRSQLNSEVMHSGKEVTSISHFSWRSTIWRRNARSPVSLSLFLEVNNLEKERELACVATIFWAQAVWTGQWEEDMKEAMEETDLGSYVVEKS